MSLFIQSLMGELYNVIQVCLFVRMMNYINEWSCICVKMAHAINLRIIRDNIKIGVEQELSALPWINVRTKLGTRWFTLINDPS